MRTVLVREGRTDTHGPVIAFMLLAQNPMDGIEETRYYLPDGRTLVDMTPRTLVQTVNLVDEHGSLIYDIDTNEVKTEERRREQGHGLVWVGPPHPVHVPRSAIEAAADAGTDGD